MKRRFALLVTTIGAMFFSIIVPQLIIADMAQVETITAVLDEYQPKITVSGSVISNSDTSIYLEIPVIASSIDVSVGDYVVQGQRLFTVDKEKTVETLLGSASLLSLLPSYIDVSALTELINGNLDEFIDSDYIPTEVYASTSGYISTLNTSTTDISGVDSPVAIISQNNDDFVAKFSVSEEYAHLIEEGQTALVTIFSGFEFAGKIISTENVVQTVYSGVNKEKITYFEVRFDYSSSSDVLIGTTVTGEIYYTEVIPSYSVPFAAVNQDEDNNEYLYVINGYSIEKRYITIVGYDDGNYYISDGISVGDSIVADFSDITDENSYVFSVNTEGEDD